MRQQKGKTGRLLAAALALASLSAAKGGEPAQTGRSQGGSAPLPYYRNAALPHPKDLIQFDERPVSPNLIVELDELGSSQSAFPVYYGALPVTPSSGRYDAAPSPNPFPPPPSATSQIAALPAQPYTPPPFASSPVELGSGDSLTSRVEGTADIAVPAPGGVVSTGSALIASTTSDAGFLDYQAYLDRARDKDVALAETAAPSIAPPPPSASPLQRVVSDPGFVPPPPPPELLEQAQTDAAAGTPELAAKPVGADEKSPTMEPLPLPPPPLPELPNHRAPRPDLNKLHEEFNKLRAFCETDSLGSAAEVFAGMPDFGEDEEMNRIRADAANLLILGLSRTGDLPSARRVYDSLPTQIVGFEAMLAKARAIINLTTYYVRAEQYNDAYAVLMDIGTIQNRSALNNELFRLMARMIPYLDNAEETEKAQTVFDLLLKEVKSPGTAALFADNTHGVIRYYLHYVDRSESPQRRRKRLDVLEHIYDSLKTLSSNPDIAELRKSLGMDLTERFSANPERAARFSAED